MSFKDIWKDKIDGQDDALAEDINIIAQEAIRLDSDKVDKVPGKDLSSNDFTDEYKNKLDNLGEFDNPEIEKEIEENTKARHTHENKTVLDEITAERVEKWDNAQSSGDSIEIVDNLISTDTDKALSANMGRELKEQIDNKMGDIDTALDSIIGIQNELIGGDSI